MAGNALLNGMMPNMMQNNPLMQMIQMLKGGGNPQAMFQQMASKNPQMQQIMNMVNGKSTSEMSEMMKNAAQERGVDLGQLASQLGMPKNVAEKYGIKID